MMVATIQALFSTMITHIPRLCHYKQDILNHLFISRTQGYSKDARSSLLSDLLQELKVIPWSQGYTLKVTSRMQAFPRHFKLSIVDDDNDDGASNDILLKADTLRLMNDGIKNELDMILFFTMMVATIQAPHGFFFLLWSYTIPRLCQYKASSIYIFHFKDSRFLQRFKVSTLKVSPRIQGFYSHLIYYKGSRFSKDSRSLLLFDSIQGLKVTPRIQGLLSRALQGYKVILLSRINSNKTLVLLYSLLFHSRSIVPSFYSPRLVSPFGLLPSSTIKTPILFSLSL